MQTNRIVPGEVLLRESTMKRDQSGTQPKPPYQHRGQSQPISLFGLTVEMHVQPVSGKGVADDLAQIIQAALHVDISRVFDLAVLVDLQNFADLPATPQFVGHKLRLDSPA